jgi:hypothetical protein
VSGGRVSIVNKYQNFCVSVCVMVMTMNGWLASYQQLMSYRDERGRIDQ